MKDFQLLKSQRNEVFNWIRVVGLIPSEFSWATSSSESFPDHSVSRITHFPTGYFLSFDRSSRWHQMYFSGSPGRNEISFSRYGTEKELWSDDTKIIVQEWLNNLKKEIDAPDLWKLAHEENNLLDSVGRTSTLENTPFLEDEQLLISLKILEIRNFLINTQDLNVHHQQTVKKQLEYLVESSKRLGRKDWMNIGIGALFSLAMQLYLPAEPSRQLLHMFSTFFRHLIRGLPSVGFPTLH